MMACLVKKLRNVAGETLVESLVSMLIITMVFAFLVTAIVTAAKINDSVKAEDVSIDLSQTELAGSVEVTISSTEVPSKTVSQDLYALTDNGEARYYYYEAEASS